MNPTTVISVRGIKGDARVRTLADPDFVYVGRRCAGWPHSYWGNPFKPKMDAIKAIGVLARLRVMMSAISPYEGDGTLSVADCLKWYQVFVENSGLCALLPELSGKRLGCWCGNWSPGEPEIECHAVVLAKLADRSES